MKRKKGEQFGTLINVKHFIDRTPYLALTHAWPQILNFKNKAFVKKRQKQKQHKVN